jgi:Flp pilus assembly protein TadG
MQHPRVLYAGARARRQGTAAIEFGLVSPLLLILLTAIVEIGIAAYQDIQLQTAVEAGALYAATYGAGNLTAIGQAVVNATGNTAITASPAPTKFCGCPAAAGVVSQGADCTTACADGKAPGQYVKVNAQVAHYTIMPYLSLALPATLTASVTVRIQ